MNRAPKFFLITIIILIIVPLLAVGAFALQTDGAGNALETLGNNPVVDIKGDYIFLFTSGNDKTPDVISGQIGGDLLMVGGKVKVDDTTIGGNIRGLAYDIEIDNTRTKNITFAALNLDVGKNAYLDALYFWGTELNFAGNCDYLEANANTVYIYGTITAEVVIYADTVYIVEGADFEKATIHSTNPPYYVDQTNVRHNISAAPSLAEKITHKKTPGTLEKSFANLKYKLPAIILFVLVLCLFLGKALDDAGEMFREKKGGMAGYGLLGTFVTPTLALALVAGGYTYYAGLALGLLFGLILTISTAFFAASIGRLYLPNLNKYLSSLIGASIVTVLSIFGFVGVVISILSLVYTYGYILRTFLKKDKPKQEDILPPL